MLALITDTAAGLGLAGFTPAVSRTLVLGSAADLAAGALGSVLVLMAEVTTTAVFVQLATGLAAGTFTIFS